MLLLAGGAVWWFWGRPENEETRIRRQVEELAAALCRTPSESAPTGLLKSKSVADAFTDPVSVTLDEYAGGSLTREQVLSRAMQYRALIDTASVSVAEIQVRVTGPGRAECTFSGRFSGTAKSGASHREVRDLSARFVKEEKGWKIQAIQFEKVLH